MILNEVGLRTFDLFETLPVDATYLFELLLQRLQASRQGVCDSQIVILRSAVST